MLWWEVKGCYLADRAMVKRMSNLGGSAREFFALRAPVILASALVWVIAQKLGCGVPACLLSAALTQFLLFTLAQL